MIYMLDSAFAPTLANAKAAAAAGIKLWAGYVAGGRVYHAWSRADFDVIRQAGIRPVFVHVGTDGNEAKNNAWQCGAMTGDIVALDVEAGWNDTYSGAWCSTVKAAGFVTWLYGLDSEVNAHGAPFDGVWAARYVYPTVPTPTAKESIQYWNSHDEFGVGVDRSVCDDHWITNQPNEDIMNIDIARSIVFGVLINAYGQPGSQGQIDAYAGPMAQPAANPETSLTALATDIGNDPHALINRVKKLEAATGTPTTDTALASRVTVLENKVLAIKDVL